MLEHILDILAQFGAGGGNPENLAVRFLLAAFFWAVLAMASISQWHKGKNKKDLYVSYAAIFGLARELIMFCLEDLALRQVFPLAITHLYYPPIDHALTQASYVAIGYAFLYYFHGDLKSTTFYRNIGFVSVVLLFGIVFPTWQNFLSANPQLKFGAYPGDIWLHVYMALLTGFPLLVFARLYLRLKARIAVPLLIGFSFFFLDDFLQIFCLAEAELHKAIYAPIRHNLHIWAIPCFILVYWKDQLGRVVKAKIQAERERAKSEAIIAALSDGLSIIDSNYQITYQNPSHLQLVGVKRGEYCYQVMDKQDEVCADCPASQTFMDGEIRTVEKTLAHREMTMEVTTSPMKDREGKVTEVVEIIRDITARKLLEKQFGEAQRIEAVGRLTGGVAHDFNNLLTAMFMNCDILQLDQSLPESAKGNINEIYALAHRAASLTNQLLVYSRKQIIQSKPLDLNQVVGGIENMLRRVIGENIDFSIRLGEGIGPIFADNGQLEQVIMNLIVNARDALEVSSGKISISTHTVTMPGKEPGQVPYKVVRLTVRDNGCGMPPDIQSKIFDPFYTTKEVGKGTGLGLSTVYGIVSKLDGEIEVESRPDEGTAFHISFKQLENQAVAEEEQMSSAHGADMSTGTGTILLAEDEEIIRKMLYNQLTKSGYTVLLAKNGLEALEIGAKKDIAIDLLLSDIVMPKLSGIELAEKLRQSRPDLKVLFMTGYTEDILNDHGTLDPDINLINKPFTPDKLLQEIVNIRQHSSCARSG